jgi:hypothetical protein
MVGGAFVACLMLGCAWTVYANVFGASVYPAAIVGNFDVAVIKRSPAPAVPSAAPAFDDVFAALSAPAPLSSARVNLTLGPSLTFNDRFAASSPQGEAPRPQRFRRRRTARSPLYSPPLGSSGRPDGAAAGAAPCRRWTCRTCENTGFDPRDDAEAKARSCWRPSRKRKTHDLRQAVWR